MEYQEFIKILTGYKCPVTGWEYKVLEIKEKPIKMVCTNKLNYNQTVTKYR